MISLGGRPQKDEDGVRGAQPREGPGDTKWRVPRVVGLGVLRSVMTSRLDEFRGMNGTLARSPESAGHTIGRGRRDHNEISRGIARAALR